MGRRGWIGLAGLVGIIFLGGLVRRCDSIPPPADFSYGGHLRPRVFVSHEPLIPEPGGTVTIRLAPDLHSGVTVRRAVALLRQGPGGGASHQDCEAGEGGTFVCRFGLPATPGVHVYGGHLDLSSGERVGARSSYRFSALASLAADSLIEIRVPEGGPPATRKDASPAPTGGHRIDLAWVRDPRGYSEPQFTGDVADAMFNGILADPVYRWRDDQLGFYLYTRPGFVESYFTPRDTRCGGNPWPRDAAWPAALSGMEVVGLLHRKATDSAGIEGAGAAPATVGFRDCAGQAVKQARVGTFSASGGIPERATVAKHEFGHAAFGLGDEYSESDATRRVAPPVGGIPGADCCCRIEDGAGGARGHAIRRRARSGIGGAPIGVGDGSKRCIAAGGGERILPITGVIDSALPSCGARDEGLPPHCGAAPAGGCPSLAGDCVRASAWLGNDPPAGARPARPNVFPSRDACVDGAGRAAAHPAVEDPARSLGACRELCGAETSTCPCGDAELWIADVDPRSPAKQPRSDAMGLVTDAGELNGGTCQWCVDTSLCVCWHRARGDDPARTWVACEAPPKGATLLERFTRAVTEWLNGLVAAALGRVRS